MCFIYRAEVILGFLFEELVAVCDYLFRHVFSPVINPKGVYIE
jgi:hypothetical protein